MGAGLNADAADAAGVCAGFGLEELESVFFFLS